MTTTDFGKQFAATIVAKSDQFNADDLITGSVIVTIREVRMTTEDQPCHIYVENDRRIFKPCKTMRRLLAAFWGEPTSPTVWAGRRLELYRDPTAKWAGVEQGGVRVNGMSDIKREETVMLQIAKGKKQPFTVRPLPAVQRQPDRASEDWRPAATKAATEAGVSMIDIVAACGGRGMTDWTDDDKPTIRQMIADAKKRATPDPA